MARRPSRQTAAVLTALAREPLAWRYGYELGKEIGLEAGTLYPILMRLCDRGLLEASWELDPSGRTPAPAHVSHHGRGRTRRHRGTSRGRGAAGPSARRRETVFGAVT